MIITKCQVKVHSPLGMISAQTGLSVRILSIQIAEVTGFNLLQNTPVLPATSLTSVPRSNLIFNSMAATAETDMELQFVALFGESIILSVTGLVSSALLYGIYVILFYASVNILSRREGSHIARSALLIAIVFMFVISSFQIWADVGVILTGIREIFVDSIGTSFVGKQATYAEKFSILVSVQEALGPIEVEFVLAGL
ncbi:hypothetical protein AAF712_015849 [Marasmius tenuissimus]|uniref:Uncharacterized protein n=1 Tax=Marasmius tenuissimus TaxID=585030 RepID=A0ABR2Z892_9AGAR